MVLFIILEEKMSIGFFQNNTHNDRKNQERYG